MKAKKILPALLLGLSPVFVYSAEYLTETDETKTISESVSYTDILYNNGYLTINNSTGEQVIVESTNAINFANGGTVDVESEALFLSGKKIEFNGEFNISDDTTFSSSGDSLTFNSTSVFNITNAANVTLKSDSFFVYTGGEINVYSGSTLDLTSPSKNYNFQNAATYYLEGTMNTTTTSNSVFFKNNSTNFIMNGGAFTSQSKITISVDLNIEIQNGQKNLAYAMMQTTNAIAVATGVDLNLDLSSLTLPTGNDTLEFYVLYAAAGFDIADGWDDTLNYVYKESDLLKNADGFYSIDGNLYDIGYYLEGTTGLYLTVTVIPEPSTYAMIFGTLALAFVYYRRRK